MIRMRFIPLLMFAAFVACQSVEPAPTATPLLPTSEAVATATETAVLPTPTLVSPTPVPTPTLSPATTFCPDIERPALVFFANNQLQLTDLTTTCDLPFASPLYNTVQLREEGLYYLAMGTAVWRINPDGSSTMLPFTQAPEGWATNGFVISQDGQRIAWSQAKYEGTTVTNRLQIANLDGQERVNVIGDEQRADGRLIQPVQINFDNHEVVFAYQPNGLGGIWSANTGRYDSLYSGCCGVADPHKLLDCADLGLSVCIGDITTNGRLLAYTDSQNNIILADNDGQTLRTFAHETADYVAYPTFNTDGGLIYYSATLTQDTGIPLPQPGTLHYLANPLSDETAVLVEQNGLLQPYFWLGTEQIIAGHYDGEGNWGNIAINIQTQQQHPLPQAHPITTLTTATVPLLLTEETSPDGQWRVRYGQSEAVAPAPDETERFPTGAKYRVLLEVVATNSNQHHVIVDEWRSYGLGLDWPVPYRWSRDGQSLYYTNTASADGCSLFLNGTDLQQFLLDIGETIELLPKQRTGNLALSPDEQQLAFITRQSRELLVVQQLATGVEQQFTLDIEPDAQVGALSWSPNGRFLLFAVGHNPCSPNMTFDLQRLDQETGEISTLLAGGATAWQAEKWLSSTKAIVAGENGRVYLLDVTTGKLEDLAAIENRCRNSLDIQWFFIPAPALCPASLPTENTALHQPFANGTLLWLDQLATGYALYADGRFETVAPSERDHSGNELAPFMTLPPSVANELGPATAAFTSYTAWHQQDVGTNPAPHLVLLPDITYVSLPDGTVIGLENGRWFIAGRVG